jgi:hypothetical protein
MAKVINNNTIQMSDQITRLTVDVKRMNNRINYLQGRCSTLSILSAVLAAGLIFEWLEHKQTKAQLYKLDKRINESEDQDILK